MHLTTALYPRSIILFKTQIEIKSGCLKIHCITPSLISWTPRFRALRSRQYFIICIIARTATGTARTATGTPTPRAIFWSLVRPESEPESVACDVTEVKLGADMDDCDGVGVVVGVGVSRGVYDVVIVNLLHHQIQIKLCIRVHARGNQVQPRVRNRKRLEHTQQLVLKYDGCTKYATCGVSCPFFIAGQVM